MQESREQIKTSMLRNVARAWGYSETEVDGFDPLVSMLLSACSVELEKISGEIQASRGRITERLVQILSPDVFTGALPAHAIACVASSESTTEIGSELQFNTIAKPSLPSESTPHVNKEIYFSPTDTFRLNRASIKYFGTGDRLYKITDSNSKEVIANSQGKELPSSTLWLAIDEPGVSLHNSMFYFDFHNEASRSFFYNQLSKASWYYGDHKLQHLPGYGNREISGESLDLESITGNDNNITRKITRHINAFYKPYFITLSDTASITEVKSANQELPHLIADTFGSKIAGQLSQQPLRWIRVDFPEAITSHLLHDLICIMNCFPVINRRLHDLNYRLQEMINIIPLQTEELFLDLEKVADDEGRQLNIHSVNQENGDTLSTLMRNGGVGRFDERDAASIVDYLLQLLSDESSAFSALGNDFMTGELKQLKQVMNKLEQRVYSSKAHAGHIPYLVLRNDKKNQLA